MRPFIGSALALALVALPAFILWRIVRGVENWFTYSGAGDVLGWSLVAALVLAVFAVPAAAWGIAARMWVVRLTEGQRLESTAHALAAPRARRELAYVDADPLPAPEPRPERAHAGD